MWSTTLPQALGERLSRFAQQQRVTINSVVQGAWVVLLQLYTRNRAVAFGATVAGMPPADIVNLRAFLEARRALSYTTLTIAEIAYGLGFVDPAYFTRSFTRHAGLSPRAFRQQHEAAA